MENVKKNHISFLKEEVREMTTCILLNGDYSFLNIISWQRAICLMVKGKTEILKNTDRVISNCDGSIKFFVPAVMRLIKVIRSIYRTRVPFSKRNVMVRDRFECAYCGSRKRLTIDHVIPKSRGGKSTFENCVTACKDCNNKKNNKTPSESKMYLKRQPYAPTISEYIRARVDMLGINDLLKELGVF